MSKTLEIYTHELASQLVERFENVLDDHDITVPSPEDDEREPDNKARLYGSVYSDLLDTVEKIVIDHTVKTIANADRATVITDRYSDINKVYIEK